MSRAWSSSHPVPDLGAPAVVLGGHVNALSATRSLGRRGVQVTVLGQGSEPHPVEASRWLHQYVPPEGHAAVRDQWLDWLSHAPPSILIPASDDGLQLLVSAGDTLRASGHRPVEAEPGAVATFLDKGATVAAAAAAGVRVPRTVVVEGPASVDEVAGAVGYPCALKATRSHVPPPGWTAKGVVVASAEEARAAARLAGVHLLATEVVPGPETAFCSFYTYLVDGEPLFQFTKRKLRQYPPRWGTGTLHRSEWQPELAEASLRLFRHAGVQGLANVEYKLDERDGVPVLIECNLRLTAADPMLQRAGLDLPWLLYRRAAKVPGVALPTRFRDGVYQWHPLPDVRAALDMHRTGDLSLTAWLRSITHPAVLPYWSADDPGPSLANARDLSRRIARRVAARVR